jgi:hypothetical protein
VRGPINVPHSGLLLKRAGYRSHPRRVSPPIADDPKRDAKIGRQRQAPLLASSCSVLRHRDKPARRRGRVSAGLFHKNQKIRKNNDWVAEEAV